MQSAIMQPYIAIQLANSEKVNCPSKILTDLQAAQGMMNVAIIQSLGAAKLP